MTAILICFALIALPGAAALAAPRLERLVQVWWERRHPQPPAPLDPEATAAMRAIPDGTRRPRHDDSTPTPPALHPGQWPLPTRHSSKEP